MYALIYDEHDLETPGKSVISTHKTRRNAEVALNKHMKEHGKKIWECNMRIVWTREKVKAGDSITAGQFETWRPGEVIPEGETHSDAD